MNFETIISQAWEELVVNKTRAEKEAWLQDVFSGNTLNKYPYIALHPSEALANTEHSWMAEENIGDLSKDELNKYYQDFDDIVSLFLDRDTILVDVVRLSYNWVEEIFGSNINDENKELTSQYLFIRKLDSSEYDGEYEDLFEVSRKLVSSTYYNIDETGLSELSDDEFEILFKNLFEFFILRETLEDFAIRFYLKRKN